MVIYATDTPFGENVEAFMVDMFNVFRKMVDAVMLLAVIVFFVMVSNTPDGRNSVEALKVSYTIVLP